MSSRLDRLAAAVAKQAERTGLSLVPAEPCTAGTFAALLADAPGAGDGFRGGHTARPRSARLRHDEAAMEEAKSEI